MEEFIQGLSRHERSVYVEKYRQLQHNKRLYAEYAKWVYRGERKQQRYKDRLMGIRRAFQDFLTDDEVARLTRRKTRYERELAKAKELIELATGHRNRHMKLKARLDRWFERERKFEEVKQEHWKLAEKFEGENPGVDIYV